MNRLQLTPRALTRTLTLTRTALTAAQTRANSSSLKSSIRGEFGQDFTDDFLPEREEAEIEHQMKLESQITLTKRPDDMLRHNEEYSGVVYKYDLPTINTAITFRGLNELAEVEDEPATPTQSLMETLDCDLDTAFEAFVIKHQQNYNNEVDMYGDIRRAGDCQLKVLEFGTPIPFELLADEESMRQIRSMHRVNTDIPGSLELVHPNKFLPSKLSLPDLFRSAARRRVPPHASDPAF